MKLVSVKYITESSNCIFCDVTFSRKTWFTKRKEFTKRYMLEKYEYSRDQYAHAAYTIDNSSSDIGLQYAIRSEMILQYEKTLPAPTAQQKMRQMYINLTHYTCAQRKAIYERLMELNEPIFNLYSTSSWWCENWDRSLHITGSTNEFEYLGFSNGSWIQLMYYELKNFPKMDYTTFMENLKREND